MKLDSKRLLFLISLGSILEYYDFGIFIYLAPMLGKALIPAKNEWLNLLLSYAIFAAGSFCRPLGGILFAHLGDTRGRKYTFVYTILLMAVPTFLIALIPSAQSIGIWATILLITLRILQSFAIGGELPGSVVFGYELSSPKRRAFNVALVVMGTNLGLFSSSLICTLLLKFHWQYAESWRIAFGLGGLFGIISYALRRTLVETPAFLEYKLLLQKETVPLQLLFKKHRKALFQLIGLGAFLASAIALFTYYIPNYLSFFYHLPLERLMAFNSYSILIFSAGSLIAGRWHYLFGKKFFFFLCIGLSVASLLLFWNYGRLSLSQIFFFHSLILFVIGINCGRFPVFVASFFPVGVRFTGAAIAWNLSLGLITGLTQMILTWLVKVTGLVWVPALYICFFALLALVALLTISSKQLFHYKD
ncbi:MAG: MFS transporter [Chthoniobacterales bacterium]|nr:MFS transporter [Chthoniobacterales bacterium]